MGGFWAVMVMAVAMISHDKLSFRCALHRGDEGVGWGARFGALISWFPSYIVHSYHCYGCVMLDACCGGGVVAYHGNELSTSALEYQYTND